MLDGNNQIVFMLYSFELVRVCIFDEYFELFFFAVIMPNWNYVERFTALFNVHITQ